MFVYNITVQPSHAIASEWLYWQQQIHIPQIMKTGMFMEHKFFRLLDVDESEGPTFCIQYFAASMDLLQEFLSDFAPFFQQKAFDRWGSGFIAFRTIMETVK